MSARSFSIALLLTISLPLAAETPQSSDAALREAKNQIAYSIRAEGSLLAGLRKTAPLVEAYFQKHMPNGSHEVITGDAYFLARLTSNKGFAASRLVDMNGLAERVTAGDPQIFDALPLLLAPDLDRLDPARYSYVFLGRERLGNVDTHVFDVSPRENENGSEESNRFAGRVWIEQRQFNAVRFKGVIPRIQPGFANSLGAGAWRVDGWRANIGDDRWVPSFVYVESVSPLDAPDADVIRGLVRFWGYREETSRPPHEFTDIVIDDASPTIGNGKVTERTPQRSMRMFEDEAERNVLARLQRAGLLASKQGDVERAIEQVIVNVVASNKLVLPTRLRARVLLTTPFEIFSVGNSLIISKGLLDAVDEATLGYLISHQVAHHINGDPKIASKLSFADLLDTSDQELLRALSFRHGPAAEAAADERALTLVRASPYAGSMADTGLFLAALQASIPGLRALVTPSFGEHVADADELVRNDRLFRIAPLLAPELVEQVPAPPLNAKLAVEPLDGFATFIAAEALPGLVPREKATFAVRPVAPFLRYAAESSGTPASSATD
jgi:hypothetical protein